ncbi:MAG: aminodeoxychorismate/anthranilate synthase component II [Cytophagales bacterium]|nr:aminodeoxychorismate/anthranilate synthase component II [Cytophagales bacterium]
MKILVFDNYDSFTYNLVHLIKALGYNDLEIHRNDKIALEDIKRFDKILLSPGPGIPSEAGILQPLIREYASQKPILGVCLGHQAIGEVFGGTLINLSHVFHGIATPISIVSDDLLFKGLPKEFPVGRYHSWAVDTLGFPTQEMDITAVDPDGKIMALAHKKYNVKGVQLHPESILTENGDKILKNWLED